MGLLKIKKSTAAGINFTLIAAILVLANLVGINSFVKLDLTHNNAYSLSQVSRETLARISDPLRIKVFYTEDVPAPYNSVRQYLMDMLKEFDAAEDNFFSFEVVDPGSPEGKQDAQRYGLQQVEIQEVQSDEFQSRAVFLGAVVCYGTVTEPVDQITAADGLEYRLTTAMMSAINQVDALSGTTEDVVMTAMVSPTFKEIGIQGFDEVKDDLKGMYQRINRDNFGRISFEYLEPVSENEIENLEKQYGVQPISWESRDGKKSQGLLEIVFRYGNAVERVPLEIFRGLLGGFALADPADIEDTLREALRSLSNANPRIAYEMSAGEKDVNDYQSGAGPYSMLLKERYELSPVKLSDEDIPAGIHTLIINGPEQSFSEKALYRIDQFLLGGGSLLVFLDNYIQFMPPQQQQRTQPIWLKNETGLEPLLEHWGVRLTGSIVLDEESFVLRQGGRSQKIFQAPSLSGDGINRDNVITSGLQDIIVLEAGELLPAQGVEGPVYTALLKTSPLSWTVEKPEDVGPWIQGAPKDADLGSRDVAVLLEGNFSSNFSEPIDLGIQDIPSGGDMVNRHSSGADNTIAEAEFHSSRFVSESLDKGRILLVSSSALTTPQMLNPRSSTPNSMFLLNAVDYINGAPGMAALRSKGLGIARIKTTTPAARLVARWGNTVIVPFLVVVLGLIIWNFRRSRSRRIQSMFNKNRGEI